MKKETVNISSKQAGGALADGLTFVRLFLTPVIMAVIISSWPDIKMAVFASILFLVAAVTDIFDDYFGGTSRSIYRKYGWIDDIADTVLVTGTLIALLWVMAREDLLNWTFALPALVLIVREIVVGVLKGRQLRKFGWPDYKLSNAKVGFSVLAVSVLVASPWLSQFMDVFRAADDSSRLLNIGSPWVWVFGVACLWLAAVLSVSSAIRIFRTKFTANDA
jgi:phosphatidylglycerophosphate synthase